MTTLKGPGEVEKHDGSALRIAIVHARWNMPIISPLLAGAKSQLLASGVQESNIVIQSVPGSWELPIATKSLYAASQIQSSTSASGGHSGGGSTLLSLSAGDLLGASSSATDLSLPDTKPETATEKEKESTKSTAAFDAIIAIGVLIKGETMHFEYIADAVSQGLMRVQLDTGVPLVFGLLTVLDEEQARARAGIAAGSHNHGEDWGRAAVELGVKRREWAEGKVL